jgi:hypothetical protein
LRLRRRLQVKGYRLRIDFGCIPLLATGFTAARDIPQTDVGYTTERETDKPQDDIVDTTSIWLVSRGAAVLQRAYGKRSLRSAAVGGDTSSSIGGIAVALFVAKKVLQLFLYSGCFEKTFKFFIKRHFVVVCLLVGYVVSDFVQITVAECCAEIRFTPALKSGKHFVLYNPFAATAFYFAHIYRWRYVCVGAYGNVYMIGHTVYLLDIAS